MDQSEAFRKLMTYLFYSVRHSRIKDEQNKPAVETFTTLCINASPRRLFNTAFDTFAYEITRDHNLERWFTLKTDFIFFRIFYHQQNSEEFSSSPDGQRDSEKIVKIFALGVESV